jgi:hypothetical protein
MHIYLAHQVAEQLDRGYVYDNIGSFFLGSTTPDIRAMTKWPREQTHFSLLSVEEVGTGTRTMFENYPALLEGEGVTDATRSFMMGYISHLAADETWITSVYRANFDTTVVQARLTADQVQADIWDRAIQLDMDRQSLPDLQHKIAAQEAVSCGDEGVSVAFLGDGLLAEWKQWVGRFMGMEFDWERLKRALNRMYRDNDDVQYSVGEFLERMPRSLEEVYEKIPEARVEAYRQQAVAATIAQIREFVPA